MNAFTSACLLIWTTLSVLSAFFAPSPWPGLGSLALSLVAWAVFTSHDPIDDNRTPTNLRDRDRW